MFCSFMQQMKIRQKIDKVKASWIESDRENENPLNVGNINTFSYDDVIVLEDGFNQLPSTSHVQPTNDPKILCDVNEGGKSRSTGRVNNLLFNGKYFTLKSKTLTKTEAKCMCCGTILKGYSSSSSNFLTHLRNVRVKLTLSTNNYKICTNSSI